MARIQCAKGHFYENSKHSICPFCKVVNDVSPDRTQAAPMAAGGKRPGGRDGSTQPSNAPSPARAREDVTSPVTIGIFSHRTGIDPVVGWIVCTGGPNIGRDYRLHTDFNKIGRDPAMDVCIEGDPTISRDTHCQIVFSPRNKRFNIVPGDGRSLVYVNGDEVLAARLLNPFDVIEIGESTFQFQSFCGDKFDWSALEKKEKVVRKGGADPEPDAEPDTDRQGSGFSTIG